MSSEESFTTGLHATAVSIAVNVALGVDKLVCGLLGNSYALVADAVESLGDAIRVVIVRTGLVIASKPADSNHLYGHGKAEPIAALAVSVLMLAAAATITAHAFEYAVAAHDQQ